jgi:predicted secreted protein
MAKFNATALVVKCNGSIVGHTTSATLNINQAIIDATTKDSAAWTEGLSGLRDWSIDVEGLTDYSASFGADELADLIINRATVTVEFGTGTTSDTKFSGTCNLASLTQDAPLEDVASFSGSLTGTGALAKATY